MLKIAVSETTGKGRNVVKLVISSWLQTFSHVRASYTTIRLA